MSATEITPEVRALLDVAASLTLKDVDTADSAAVNRAIESQRGIIPDEQFKPFTSLVRLKAMNDANESGEKLRTVKIEPEDFDFEVEEPDPDYIVDKLFERKTVGICSGDTGAAKSILFEDFTVQATHGREWMGRDIPSAVRVLYVDEENPRRIVRSRLGALGMTNGDREKFRYYRRKGIQFGAEVWNRWAREECEEFRPDVVVVDTVAAGTDVEVNDNDAVAALYTRTLRPLAEDFDCMVLLLHHERKPGAQETRHAGYAMMGARQWAGQADVHIAVKPTSEYVETPRDDGGVDTHKAFEFQVVKGRDGIVERPERFTVEGVKNDCWKLTDLAVKWGGRVEAATLQDDDRNRILRHMSLDPEAKFLRKEVATVLGEKDPKEPGGTFKRAWDDLKDKGLTEKDGQGVRLTEKGREEAAKLALPVVGGE